MASGYDQEPNASRDNLRARAMVASAGVFADFIDDIEDRLIVEAQQIVLPPQGTNIYQFGSNLSWRISSGFFVGYDPSTNVMDRPFSMLLDKLHQQGLVPEDTTDFVHFVVIDGLRFALRFITGSAQAIADYCKNTEDREVKEEDLLLSPDFHNVMNSMSFTGFGFYTNSPIGEKGINDFGTKFPAQFRNFVNLFQITCGAEKLGLSLHPDAEEYLRSFAKAQNQGGHVSSLYTLRSEDDVLTTSGCPAARGRSGSLRDSDSGIGRLCLVIARAYEACLQSNPHVLSVSNDMQQ